MGQNQKQQTPARADMNRRQRDPRPAPSDKEINRQLGRDLIEMERDEQRRRGMR